MHRILSHSEFQKLALAELDAVYRLAYHLAARGDQADDLVQETYLRAFKATGAFSLANYGVRPYLFKILHNVVYSKTAKDQKHPTSAYESMDDVASKDVAADDRCTELKTLNWDSIDERLKQAIAALPLPHRTVFLLCAVEDLRYRDIAEVVGVPVGTVMSRLHHARQLLSRQLSDYALDHGIERKNSGIGNESSSTS